MRPNYGYEKRGKEIAKKKKQEAKRARKQGKKIVPQRRDADQPPDEQGTA